MEGLAKRSPLPKICYSNETIMNGHKKVIAYLKKIHKNIVTKKKLSIQKKITQITPCVLLILSFFHQNLIVFVILKNKNKNCVSIPVFFNF